MTDAVAAKVAGEEQERTAVTSTDAVQAAGSQRAADPISTTTTEVAKKAAGLGISLDVWAVALALASALAVWAGWIKQVPW